MDKKPGGIVGLVVDNIGKIVTSEKFLEYVSEADLSELVATAMQSPYAAGILEKIKMMGRELKVRYNVTSWRYNVDRANNKFIAELDIATHELRQDFATNFHNFIKALREKSGIGFDLFAQFYKIEKIRCVEVGEKVLIEILTPRVNDLEKCILEFSTADVKYEGGEEEENE